MTLLAAEDPSAATRHVANGLNQWLQQRHPDYVRAVTTGADGRPTGKLPFERFFHLRGLTYNYQAGVWTDESGDATTFALQGRAAILQFGLHYGRLIHQPENFSPYSLQHSAEILNSRLQATIEALNLDVQDLFVAPTLDRIEQIVRRFKEVDYAQVGKTSVASLSGVATAVTSKSVSAFDVTPPLRLTELLQKAGSLSTELEKFIPEVTKPGAAEPTTRLAGTLPVSQLAGLIGAFGEERSVWRELAAGVSLTITPDVLRDMTSAELEIDLKTGDPQAGSREEGVRPLSRVSQHDVKTKVYVNALDFFDLSTFASQSTLQGERGYVPVVGPIWRGLFSDVPVVGKLFSWQRGPQTVYHRSLVLTNSFITPTAMGVAVLYPTELIDLQTGQRSDYTDETFTGQSEAVNNYLKVHVRPRLDR